MTPSATADTNRRTAAPLTTPPLDIGDVRVDPPILQAPMAGYTNYAFRQIVRSYGGVGLQATEMVNARGFVWMDRNKANIPTALWGCGTSPEPLAVQIWDNDPEMLAAVGRTAGSRVRRQRRGHQLRLPRASRSPRRLAAVRTLLRDPNGSARSSSASSRACEPRSRSPPRSDSGARAIHDQRRRSRSGSSKSAGRRGADRSRPHRRRHVSRYRPTGNAIARSQTAPETIPLIGNGDLDSAEKAVVGVPPLRRRRSNDRPRRAWPTVDLSRKRPRRCAAIRSRPTRRSTNNAAACCGISSWS